MQLGPPLIDARAKGYDYGEESCLLRPLLVRLLIHQASTPSLPTGTLWTNTPCPKRTSASLPTMSSPMLMVGFGYRLLI